MVSYSLRKRSVSTAAVSELTGHAEYPSAVATAPSLTGRRRAPVTDTPLTLTMLSPLPVYLDETTGSIPLAPRPRTLDGRVIGLLPNWRPSAVELLRAVGILLAERYGVQAVVLEQPVRELPQHT